MINSKQFVSAAIYCSACGNAPLTRILCCVAPFKCTERYSFRGANICERLHATINHCVFISCISVGAAIRAQWTTKPQNSSGGAARCGFGEMHAICHFLFSNSSIASMASDCARQLIAFYMKYFRRSRLQNYRLPIAASQANAGCYWHFLHLSQTKSKTHTSIDKFVGEEMWHRIPFTCRHRRCTMLHSGCTHVKMSLSRRFTKAQQQLRQKHNQKNVTTANNRRLWRKYLREQKNTRRKNKSQPLYTLHTRMRCKGTRWKSICLAEKWKSQNSWQEKHVSLFNSHQTPNCKWLHRKYMGNEKMWRFRRHRNYAKANEMAAETGFCVSLAAAFTHYAYAMEHFICNYCCIFANWSNGKLKRCRRAAHFAATRAAVDANDVLRTGECTWVIYTNWCAHFAKQVLQPAAVCSASLELWKYTCAGQVNCLVECVPSVGKTVCSLIHSIRKWSCCAHSKSINHLFHQTNGFALAHCGGDLSIIEIK